MKLTFRLTKEDELMKGIRDSELTCLNIRHPFQAHAKQSMEKDSQEALQSEEKPNYVASPIDGLWSFICQKEFFSYFKIKQTFL